MTELTRALGGRQPQSIRTALAVLRAVAQAPPGVTARQISRQLGLPPATAYRILNLLVGDEYLVRLPDLRGFALGARMADLLGPPSGVRAGVASVVSALRSSTGLAVTLATYSEEGVRIAVADPRRPALVDGLAVAHPHASALGRLLLAARPDWRARLPAALPRLTAATTTEVARLDLELAAVRRDAVAVQLDEVHPGLGCVAVPVHDPAGRLRAGLTVSAGSQVVRACATALLAQLRSAAAELAPLLTHPDPALSLGAEDPRMEKTR